MSTRAQAVANMAAAEQLQVWKDEISNMITEGMNNSPSPSIGEMHAISPGKFSGAVDSRGSNWIEKFESYCRIAKFSEDEAMKRDMFSLMLSGAADQWYKHELIETDKANFAAIKVKFLEKFKRGPTWVEQSELAERKQRPDEPVSQYITDMRHKCAILEISQKESILHFVRGLKVDIRKYVIGCNPQTLRDAEDSARLGESMDKLSEPSIAQSANVVSQDSKFDLLLNKLHKQETLLKETCREIDTLKLDRSQQQPDRRQSDQGDTRNARRDNYHGNMQTTRQDNYQGGYNRIQPTYRSNDGQQSQQNTKFCSYCSKNFHTAAECYKKKNDEARGQQYARNRSYQPRMGQNSKNY